MRDDFDSPNVSFMERDFGGGLLCSARKTQQQNITDGFPLCNKNKNKTNEIFLEELKIPIHTKPFKIYNRSLILNLLSFSLSLS